ncbi:VTE6-related protein [Gossypium australe]|uniref:VTE6-related protein n=1 Tax=Gossypium australe TaxID=47621 RepID=A0A5B6W6B4_9ROSI|nr:VTE6-related protein [Gossypium australe]
MERTLTHSLIAVVISALAAIRSYRRKSLDLSGAVAGFLVMTIHFAVGYRFGAMLLAFFFTSSMLTKVGEDKKRQVDADFKEGGQRNWDNDLDFNLLMNRSKNLRYGNSQFIHFRIQVLYNSGIAAVLSVLIGNLTGWEDKCLDSNDSVLITSLIGGIIGHYSCCNGDTWSSEIGVLSSDQPRLITTFKELLERISFLDHLDTVLMHLSYPFNQPNIAVNDYQSVRRGTNGGVTKTGLLAALAAGSVIGLTFVLVGFLTTRCSNEMAMKQLLVIPLSAVAGLLGSIIDSLLGATLQFSGFCSVRNKIFRPSKLKTSSYHAMINEPFNAARIVVGKPGPTVKRISGLNFLDNNAVNLVSILLTTLLTSFASVYIF